MRPAAPALLFVLGCAPEAPIAPDAGDDTGVPGPRDVPVEAPEVRALDDAGGVHVRVAARGAGWVAAWWTDRSTPDGTCDGMPDAPPRLRRTVRAAFVDGAAVTRVDVASPVVPLEPPGLDLLVEGDGVHVAFTGGEPEGRFCGGHDAVVATSDGGPFVATVAASTSGEAATGLPGSDAGFVVGLHPALAMRGGDLAVLYGDAHFGALQRDDRFRADVEIAVSDGGSWRHEAIDAGEGAGAPTALAVDGEGRLVAAYAIPFDAAATARGGVWAARRDADGWTRVRLHDGPAPDAVAVAVDAEGAPVVAFGDPDRGVVRVRRLDGAFDTPADWDVTEVGDPRFVEGRAAALAVADDGRLVLAHRRCRRVTATRAGCDPNDEAVLLAVVDGQEVTSRVVLDGTGSDCGTHLDVAVRGDRYAVVAACAAPTDGGWRARPWLVEGRLP